MDLAGVISSGLSIFKIILEQLGELDTKIMSGKN